MSWNLRVVQVDPLMKCTPLPPLSHSHLQPGVKPWGVKLFFFPPTQHARQGKMTSVQHIYIDHLVESLFGVKFPKVRLFFKSTSIQYRKTKKCKVLQEQKAPLIQQEPSEFSSALEDYFSVNCLLCIRITIMVPPLLPPVSYEIQGTTHNIVMSSQLGFSLLVLIVDRKRKVGLLSLSQCFADAQLSGPCACMWIQPREGSWVQQESKELSPLCMCIVKMNDRIPPNTTFLLLKRQQLTLHHNLFLLTPEKYTQVYVDGHVCQIIILLSKSLHIHSTNISEVLYCQASTLVLWTYNSIKYGSCLGVVY